MTDDQNGSCQQRFCASGGAVLRLTVFHIIELRFFVSSVVVKIPA
jgi:hypothetical protein